MGREGDVYTGNEMPVKKPQPESPREATRIEAAIDERLDQELFKALSDSTRLLVLSCLIKVGRPCTASELAECCDVEFSVANKHLKILVAAEVLRSEKRGRTVWYEARCGDLCDRLLRLIDAIVVWCPNLRGEKPTKTGQSCCGTIREG